MRSVVMNQLPKQLNRLVQSHIASAHGSSRAYVPGAFRNPKVAERQHGSSKGFTGSGSTLGGSGGGRGGPFIRAASGGPGGEGGGGGKGLWAKYLEFLDSYPMLSRAATCGVLNGLGDIFSQLCVEQLPFDGMRCLKFTMMGLVFVGPILALWYGNLGKLITASGLTGTILTLLVDQFLFAPPFVAACMSVITALEGKPDQIMPKLKQDWLETIKVNWVLWIPAQFINFKFVPPNLTVLAVNITALIWNVYLSFQSHKVVASATQ